MKILDTAVKQRAYDDMWMLLGKTPDYDNAYRYRDENNVNATYTPPLWVILDVKHDKDQLRVRRGIS